MSQLFTVDLEIGIGVFDSLLRPERVHAGRAKSQQSAATGRTAWPRPDVAALSGETVTRNQRGHRSLNRFCSISLHGIKKPCYATGFRQKTIGQLSLRRRCNRQHQGTARAPPNM